MMALADRVMRAQAAPAILALEGLVRTAPTYASKWCLAY